MNPVVTITRPLPRVPPFLASYYSLPKRDIRLVYHEAANILAGRLMVASWTFGECAEHTLPDRRFSARVGDSPIFGNDIVRFNDAGKMVDLVVKLRPVDVVAKPGQEAARRMAAAKPAAQD